MSNKQMIEVEERFEIKNDGIRVKELPLCILCGSAGGPLYHDLSDRLGSAPGRWAYKRCPKDGLVWLDPHPNPEEILKLYCGYDLTHTVTEFSTQAIYPVTQGNQTGHFSLRFRL